MAWRKLDIYDEIASDADWAAAFLLRSERESSEPYLRRLAPQLMTLSPDLKHAQALSRALRFGTGGIPLWLKATAAACHLALARRPLPEEIGLPKRLACLSWAWCRKVPSLWEPDLHVTDKLLLSLAPIPAHASTFEEELGEGLD